jgi:cation diffusion facilitator family transporter
MKIPVDPFTIPEEKRPLSERAKRLEWITIAFILSVVVVISAVMGSSQTMKAVWVEDLLSLIPPAAFLFGRRFNHRAPNARFPYGYRRAITIAFLTAAVALVSLGLYILIDSILKLIEAEAPTINSVSIFGKRVWLGWLMIAALVYSVIPPFILGRMKEPLAKELHDKALYTDAHINRGDWLAGVAGVLGIVGIAYGYWWADCVAAVIVSCEIIRDGFSDLRHSIGQLMNKRPSTVEDEEDPVPAKIEQELERLDWVQKARARLREDGDVLTGEAFVVPSSEEGLLDRLQQATDVANSVDWRVYDVNVVPVKSIDT